jgi:orotate phosphoribosyltransferase
MGAIPLAVSVSRETGIPSAFIRKERKSYGTCNYAEGVSLIGKKVVIIEDIITSGSAVIDALEKMKQDKINIVGIICVIDRNAGGCELIESYGIPVQRLFILDTK